MSLTTFEVSFYIYFTLGQGINQGWQQARQGTY